MLSKPPSCNGCVLLDLGRGFMAPSGHGTNGVLLVGEALGSNEVEAGQPFVGKAGFTLDKILSRGGLNRDEFLISNTVYCQPPENKLSGMWYAQPAIEHCRPNLDSVIARMRPRAIVALGGVASKRLIPNLSVGVLEARGYVFWSEAYQTWIIPTVHPSFVMRGKTAWAQVLLFDIQKAVDIARNGYSYAVPDYSLDVTPAEAMKWVQEFESYADQHADLYLSTDIETPGKTDIDEEELDLEDGQDYQIQRCGYSYRDRHGLSIPWDGVYRVIHERLLAHKCQKLFHNGAFDVPRLLASGVEINGAIHDSMDAWHVLNSDLKKSLGFITPFFCLDQPMWKNKSSTEPAYYNCVDADVAGRNMRGTVELLKKGGMWQVYQEFICELDPVYSSMTRAGMPIDLSKRVMASKQLIGLRDTVRAKIQQIVPVELKPRSPKNGYVRTPPDTRQLTEQIFGGIKNKYCPKCNLSKPTKAHFKAREGKFCSVCSAKFTKAHTRNCSGVLEVRESNPCAGLTPIERIEGEKRWVKIADFVPSTKGIILFQQFNKHPLIFAGKGSDKKPTTDEKAIRKLIGRHPDTAFYPLVLEDREYTKLGGTYIGWWDDALSRFTGGFPLGRDGRIHGHFRHTPSTLRSSMVSPNLQNIPRGDSDEIQALVKSIFIAPPGSIFVERDFSGIEARLVGYHANSRDYYRLSGIDVHSYFTAYNLYRTGVFPASDLPNLAWSDDDLAGYLHGIKKRFKLERSTGKVCIHAGNYRIGPSHLSEMFPHWFPRPKDAAKVLAFYYEVFPAIPQWHERVCLQVDKSAVIRNSFGHVHRFYQVLNWERRGTEWEWTFGDDAKRLIAFGPQSDAAFIGKKALKRLFYDYQDTLAQWLRLFIHDSIFCEVPKEQLDYSRQTMQLEMERPIEEMPLDPKWGYGPYVTVGTEDKYGTCWGDMAA